MNLEKICAKVKDIVIGKERTVVIKSVDIGQEYTGKTTTYMSFGGPLGGFSVEIPAPIQLRSVAVEIETEEGSRTITGKENVLQDYAGLDADFASYEVELLVQSVGRQFTVRARGYDSGLLKKIAYEKQIENENNIDGKM